MLLPLITVAAQPTIDALPRPNVNGYSVAVADQTVRTNMESGTPRVRVKYSAGYDVVSLSWSFTAEEMQAFREWYVNEGVGKWFYLTLADGYGLNQREVRFVRPWNAEAIPGMHWQVSAVVEVR